MISFDMDEGRFELRVAGLAINNGKVLLHRFEGYNFWAVPGGRAELFEDTKATVIREMKEQLNEINVVPKFLKERLKDLPTSLEHIIER